MRENLGLFFWGIGLIAVAVYLRCEFAAVGPGSAPVILHHASNLLLLVGIGVLAYAGVLTALSSRSGANGGAHPSDWDTWP